MRLINADDLWDKVEESKRHNPHFDGAVRRTHNHEHDHFLRMIDKAPTIDAVPVVRCRECVLSGNCSAEDTFRLVAGIDDPFCCVGKRKDGDG